MNKRFKFFQFLSYLFDFSSFVLTFENKGEMSVVSVNIKKFSLGFKTKILKIAHSFIYYRVHSYIIFYLYTAQTLYSLVLFIIYSYSV